MTVKKQGGCHRRFGKHWTLSAREVCQWRAVYMVDLKFLKIYGRKRGVFSPGFIICICEIKLLDVFLKNPYLRRVRNIGRACWCKPGLCNSLDLYLRGTAFECRPGYQLSCLRLIHSSETRLRCAMAASFHILT